MGRNRLPPACSRYRAVADSRSESAATALLSISSTRSSRPRMSASKVASGGSSPGITRLLIASPSQNRCGVDNAQDDAWENPQDQDPQRRDGEDGPWPYLPVALPFVRGL